MLQKFRPHDLLSSMIMKTKACSDTVNVHEVYYWKKIDGSDQWTFVWFVCPASDVVGGYQSSTDDGELSASTSDSQGSVIQVVGNRRQRLTRSPSPASMMSSTGTWPSSGKLRHRVGNLPAWQLPAESVDFTAKRWQFTLAPWKMLA